MPLKLPRRAALILPAALAACGSAPKAKIPGVQIPVLPAATGLEVAPNAPAVSVPAPARLEAWPLLLANADHAPGNVTGPTGFSPRWRVRIGTPGGLRQPLAASPVVANGRVFTMDADAMVSAFSLASGEHQWRTVTRPKHVSVVNIGGGIGYDESTGKGIVYASTGYSELLALDAASGKILWRQALDFPARSAPTIAGGIVALNIQNDLLVSFDPATGTPGWRYIGRVAASPTSLALAGAPAVESNIVLAGFSSGTLAALDLGSGTPLWEQSLASPFGQASELDFSDISGAPAIANGVVYAASLGQTMMAVDIRSGAKVWVKEASGTEAFCAVGDFVYVIDTEQNLAAIHADDGLVSWQLKLPQYRNVKKQAGPKTWHGPVMINNQLLLASSLGDLAAVDPVAGKITGLRKLGAPADMPPLAAGGLLLQLTRDAVLTAYS